MVGDGDGDCDGDDDDVVLCGGEAVVSLLSFLVCLLVWGFVSSTRLWFFSFLVCGSDS